MKENKRVIPFFFFGGFMKQEEINKFKKSIIKTEKKKKKSNKKWIWTITLLAFFISFFFSFASETIMANVSTLIEILFVIIFILVGILFDMIGVAVTSASEKPFHSMSAKKIRGANVAVQLKKNADKVSSFCNDVIGDICGIISGSAGVYIASSCASEFALSPFFAALFVTAMIASLTIGGKAIGKGVAINNSTMILYQFSKIISYVYQPKNKG